MPRLDDMSPERLDALVDGASPDDSDERELVTMMNELRELEPEAPEELAATVRAAAAGQAAAEPTGGTAPGLWARISEPFRARPRLAWGLAPAALVIALAVITVPAITDGGDPSSEAIVDAATAESSDDSAAQSAPPLDGGSFAESEESAADVAPERLRDDDAARAIAPGVGGGGLTAPPVVVTPQSPVPDDALAPGTDPNRPQELFGRTTLGVTSASALSNAAAGAMDLARELGGFTERSEFGTQSDEQGRADLVLRVPTDQTERALTGFADLGTVIDQQVSINDLGEEVAAAQDRVTQLNKRVSQLRSDLADDPGNTRLENQLASAERALERARANRTATNEQVEERTRFATLNLSILITDQIGATSDENRFAAAIDRAWDRLGGVLAGALELLIVASPLILIAGLGAWGLRVARRRSDDGLLAKN